MSNLPDDSFVWEHKMYPPDDPYCTWCDEFGDAGKPNCPFCGRTLVYSHADIQGAKADEAYDRLKGK